MPRLPSDGPLACPRSGRFGGEPRPKAVTSHLLRVQPDRLGGTPELANYAALTPDFRDAGEAMAEMAKAIQDNPAVEIRSETTVTGATGEAGAFDVTVEHGGVAMYEAKRAGGVILVQNGLCQSRYSQDALSNVVFRRPFRVSVPRVAYQPRACGIAWEIWTGTIVHEFSS